MKSRIAVALLAIVLSGDPLAASQEIDDPVKQGYEAFFQGDYKNALMSWKSAAVLGDGHAQYNLGLMHRNGDGVLQDYAEAIKWYRLAAKQGDARAQNGLGLMYAMGQGVPQDYAEAYAWFNVAAAQGYADAKSNRDIVSKELTLKTLSKA